MSSVLNWGALLVGFVLFLIGQLFLHHYQRAYKAHVLQYGRIAFGKEIAGWPPEAELGARLARTFWTIGPVVAFGCVFFFWTPLAEVGLPLWIGCTLGASGLATTLLAFGGGASLAKREVTIALAKRRARQGGDVD